MLTPEEHALRRQLHSEGLSDRQIAERVCTTRKAINQWRHAAGLAPRIPSSRREAAVLSERLSLYESGLSDGRIAELQAVHPVTILHWRRRLRLGANFPPPFTGPCKRTGTDWSDTVRELHSTGASDIQISRLMQQGRGVGRYWRLKLGLPRNFEPICGPRRGDGVVRPTRNTIRVISVADYSLDAPSPSGKAWVENLRDDSWSNWLEEMGATVW